MPSYLITRNGVRYFARRVPAKLVPLIGKRFWRETLATADDAEAHRRATLLNADCEQAIAVATLEYRRQRSAVARLTGDERAIVEAAGGLGALRQVTVGQSRKLEAKAATVWQSLPLHLRNGLPGEWLRLTLAQRKWLIERWAALPDHDRNALFRQDRGLKDEATYASAAAEMLAGVAAEGRAALASEGIDLDALQEELAEAEARAATLRDRLERNLTILRKGEEGEPDPDLASEDPARQGEGEDLITVLDRWARESGAPDQHVGQYRYAVTRFHELHGRLTLKDITRAHLRQFKDAIAKLPRSTRTDIRSATLARAVAIAEREKLPRIGEKTTRKHVMALSTLLGHAVSWGYIEKSPADGLRFIRKREKRSHDAEPKGFTPSQLRALDASLTAEYQNTDDDRWLPIVCAYQGCRVEEACQLTKSDIWKHDSGVWVMRITDAGQDQKIKNNPSLRTIPLHAKLIERGFLQHVERSPGPLIFASLAPDRRGRLGGPYGKRFARHLKQRTKIIGLTFHDTRHAWKTAARNSEIPAEIQRAIMGHKQEDGVAEDYGEKQGPVILAKHLNRVDPFTDPVNPH